MPTMALKEWSAVCLALASGQQSLLLRKGGIAEDTGEFRPEHSEFWLYPTFFHEQQQTGLKAEGSDWLARSEAERPPVGLLRFRWSAQVAAVYRIPSLDQALALDPLHIWNESTVRNRFAYRTPGLFALAIRVFRFDVTVTLPELPEYAGCKSWVPLQTSDPMPSRMPVQSDSEFHQNAAKIAELLHDCESSAPLSSDAPRE